MELNQLNFHDPVLDWSEVRVLFSKKVSGQCKILHCAACNKVRFQNISFSIPYSISSILDVVSFARSTAADTFLDMHDFVVLKRFRVTI